MVYERHIVSGVLLLVGGAIAVLLVGTDTAAGEFEYPSRKREKYRNTNANENAIMIKRKIEQIY